jgi:hypothetical protein
MLFCRCRHYCKLTQVLEEYLPQNINANRILPLKWSTGHGRNPFATLLRGVDIYGHLLWASLKSHVIWKNIELSV